MSMVLGIDTGGTYTDAVLLEQEHKTVVAKAKAPTTRENLAKGITACIDKLCPREMPPMDKVVLSTTLATNAIVEGEGRPTGLILIGDPPKGELPQGQVIRVGGKVNIKGKIITPIDEEEVARACDDLRGKVEAVAVAGMMSVRNAALELGVKTLVEERCKVPVVCSHELSTQLGFHDRTVTAILNASLIPILEGFIHGVEMALRGKGIEAPIYMVKGDGNLASLSFIQKKPIESILSGPAASIIGALSLAGCEDGIVVDMGGTTTDSGMIRDNTLALSPIGARVGQWQTQIDSAMINTWGLGGDTQIIPGENGQPEITGHRILPACRGGNQGLTPTDLLHFTGDFDLWDREAVVEQAVDSHGAGAEDYVKAAETAVIKTIEDRVLSLYDTPAIPVIAIGAPAKTWYEKVAENTTRPVIIPTHHEVANAVGAALAAVEERVEGAVRPDEENDAFLGHIAGECQSFKDKEEAVAYVASRAEALSLAMAKAQGAKEIHTQVFTEDIVEKVGWRNCYIRTDIRAVAKATTLKLKNQ